MIRRTTLQKGPFFMLFRLLGHIYPQNQINKVIFWILAETGILGPSGYPRAVRPLKTATGIFLKKARPLLALVPERSKSALSMQKKTYFETPVKLAV